jgi:hypothetical protein
MENDCRLRYTYWTDERGNVHETRYYGRRIVWDEIVNPLFLAHRTLFAKPWPWDRPESGLVKEGPKSIVLVNK